MSTPLAHYEAMDDELLFKVSGARASLARPISLADAGLREREHLQEWVLSNPEIIGSDVLVITSEFDKWSSKYGSEKDRLDVLGLGSDGRLIVAELKRDAAPDTVEMQAIKYAAMASRFDLETLADAYANFRTKTNEVSTTSDDAAELIAAHTSNEITTETLRAPRIVLIASSFPPSVTAACVWLSEMGLDIKLVRVQAYDTDEGVVVTVSQHYPPPDVEDFTVAPSRAARKPKPVATLPEVEWTTEDLTKAAAVLTNATALAALDVCAERPGQWVPFEDVTARSGREPAQARGDTGGFTLSIRKHFQRSNWPYEALWAAGGKPQIYYRLSPELAGTWTQIRGNGERDQSGAAPADLSPEP